MPGVHHTNEQRLYILRNWKYKTDAEIAENLNLINEESAIKLRLSIGLVRSRIPIKDPKTIAFICEQFVSGVSIPTIAKLIGKHNQHVSNCLTMNWFKKRISESTTTITLISSI